MLVDMGGEFFSLSPLRELNKADNLQTVLAVFLAEKDFFKISDSGNLHHDGDWVAAVGGFILTTFHEHGNLHD